MAYIPPNCVSFADQTSPQIRLCIVGNPGCGKTFAVVSTFPNVIVADWDRGLTDGRLKSYNPIIMPFYDQDFCFRDYKTKAQCIAFKSWLNTEGRKLEADQTLFVDSISGLCSSVDSYFESITPVGKGGEPDGFFTWNQKKKYLRDVHMVFKSLKCHVVCSMHTSEERNKDGVLLGKSLPSMTGSFKEELGSHYTDVIRAISTPESKGVPATYLWKMWRDGNDDYIKVRGKYATNTVPASYLSLNHEGK